MISSPLRLICVASALAVLAGCAHDAATKNGTATAADSGAQKCEPPDSQVVATFGEGGQVTMGELRQHAQEPLAELEKQRHQTLSRALEEVVLERLVQAEAKKRGQTEEAFLSSEIDKVPEPPEEEVRKLYEAAKERLPEDATYEKVRPEIVEFLQGQQKQKRARELFDELKKQANVNITLPRPPAPPVKRVDVAAQGPSKGPENAPVTIVEFSDFECPFCQRGASTLDKVVEKYGDKVRVVFRHFPLSFHPNAQKAAEAAMCAHDEGKFWQMHDLLFANQRALDEASLKGYAKQLGLDEAKFAACLQSGEKASIVTSDMAAGQKVGVTGTPAFFINGIELTGAQPLEEFEAIIDRELEQRAN